MSTVTQITNGYKITGANSIAAALSLSPANGTAEFIGKFPSSAANSPNQMTCSLVYNPSGGGQQSGSINVGAATSGPQTFPSSTFSNRTVSYTITDTGSYRTVDITVQSTNGSGTNESWTLNFQITSPSAGQTTFFVVSETSEATVSGVTASP